MAPEEGAGAGAGDRFLPEPEEKAPAPETDGGAKESGGAGGGGGGETDFDSILPHLGEFGRYQQLLFLGMIPFALFFAFVLFVQIFVTVTPKSYWCRVPELQHLDLELSRKLSVPRDGDGDGDGGGGYSRCSQYVANWTRVLEEVEAGAAAAPDPAWPTAPCTAGWHFDHTDIPYTTISTELEWVCERGSYATIAQAVFFCGSIVGGVLFGWMADRYGRIPALVGCNVVGCVGGVASVFARGLLEFSAYRFLVGLAYDNCFMMMYIIVLEYVGARHRTRVANMSIALFFGLGCVALPWLALWVADWRRLLLYTSLPMLVACAAPCLIPESARWLLQQGRVEEAVVIVHRIEKINRTRVPDKLLHDFKESARLASDSRGSGGGGEVSALELWRRPLLRRTMLYLVLVYMESARLASDSRGSGGGGEVSALELWRRPLLRRMMLYLVLVYMACAIVFDALVRLSDALGLDFFLTFTLTSATEMPSVTLLTLLLDRWGRRWLACAPMMLSATACLVAAFVPSGIPSASLAIAARFCINMSYNAAIQWGAELLPTGARASGTGLVHIMGYVATVLSPFIVYLENFVPSLPLLVLALLALGGGATSLLLPETMSRDLPQSFEDGEQLMRARTFFKTRKPKDIEMREWKEIQDSEQNKPLNRDA